MFTLCTLYFVYSVFHVIFLPIPCLHNVVLCLLCVPLATSVYSILSFMFILLPFLCSHCIYSFTVFTLCTHSCITRAYQYQSIKNQSINQINLVLSVCLSVCVCVCFPYSGTSRNQAYKQQYQLFQRDTGMKYKKGFFFN